jgi:ribosome-binding factor A
MSRRTERVAELLRDEVARVLQQEAQDPRLRLVTLTKVDVAPDFSHALVYWSIFETEGSESVETVQEGLEGAAPFVRSRLARRLPLKRMPQLRFRHDPSLERGSEMLRVLREIADEQET